MVAIAGEPEVQVPPPASTNVVALPTQVVATPVMGPGIATTVTVLTAMQPPVKV